MIESQQLKLDIECKHKHHMFNPTSNYIYKCQICGAPSALRLGFYGNNHLCNCCMQDWVDAYPDGLPSSRWSGAFHSFIRRKM